MSVGDKPLVWLHGAVKSPPFSGVARVEAGYLLRKLSYSFAGSGSHNMTALLEVWTVDKRKRELLEAQGWKVAGAREFLELTDEELEYIEIKIALSQLVKQQRLRRRLTQERAAQLLGSSQSRVAKMEAGDPSVSIDLYVKSIIALGGSREELSEAMKADVFAAA